MTLTSLARRIRPALALVFIAAALAACGGGEEARPGTTSTTSAPTEAADDAQVGWWLYEGPEYELVEGGVTPDDISGSTGSLWRLLYSDSNSESNVQLIADRADSLFAQLSAGSPQVGTATVDGVEAVLRQHPGSPEDGIPPTVGAEWIDGEVFISFTGGALTEEQLREHLSHVRQVPRAEWQAAAAGVTQAGGLQEEPASGEPAE